VVHNDVEWRHVLRSGSRIRLIDFERATTREGGDFEGIDRWERKCRAEMLVVEEMLALGG